MLHFMDDCFHEQEGDDDLIVAVVVVAVAVIFFFFRRLVTHHSPCGLVVTPEYQYCPDSRFGFAMSHLLELKSSQQHRRRKVSTVTVGLAMILGRESYMLSVVGTLMI